MKYSLLLLLLIAITLGCMKEYVSSVPNSPEFIDALINKNYDEISAEMTKVLNGLNSVPSPSDAIGQQDNVNIAVLRLNSYAGLSAELVCYACIKTDPPQSEIKVVIKNSQLVRYLDITTAETLLFVSVHE